MVFFADWESSWQKAVYAMFPSGLQGDGSVPTRAGLSNGQTGQLPRALRFGGPRAF